MRDLLVEDSFVSSRDCIIIGSLDEHSTAIHLLNYTPETYHEGLYNRFTVHKPAELTWVARRQAQFLAGRLAAKNAIGTTSQTNHQVLIGEHREPIWPIGLTGSISHSQQTSIAAIKRTLTSQSGLGIDIQSLIDAQTQTQISPTIISNDESVLIKNSVTRLSESLLFTLVFSAKESFFKALFNTVHEYFDFDVVTLINIDEQAQQITLRVQDTLGGKLPQHFEVDVPFAILDTELPQVITVCNWEL